MVYYYGKSFKSGKELSKPYKSIVECRKEALKSLSASHYDTFFIYDESKFQIGEVKDYGFVGHAEYELHNHWGPLYGGSSTGTAPSEREWTSTRG